MPVGEAIYLDIAGVDPALVGGDSCTLEAPCQTLSMALATHREVPSRTWIAFLSDATNPGAETLYTIAPIEIAGDDLFEEVSLYGEKVVLTTNDDDKALASVINNARVRFFGLHLRGPASGTVTAGHGVFCNDAEVFLFDSRVSRAQNRGIQSKNCKTTIIRSQITNSRVTGVFAEGTDLLVVSSLIARNGSDFGYSGGVSIGPSSTQKPSTQLYFNSIVDNESQPAGDAAGGVRCLSLGSENPITAVGNIVQNNTGHRNVFDATGACIFQHSIVDLALDPDTGSGPGTVAFPVELAANYGLSAGAVEALDIEALLETLGNLPLSSSLVLDVDGAARHVGLYPDMGAKERQP